MKTQKEIDEFAYVYYDGMASVIDRLEAIDKVEETNKYIKEKYGKEPSDESELIIECNRLSTVENPRDKIRPIINLIMTALLVILAVFALFNNQPALIMFVVLAVVFFAMNLFEI